MRILIDDSSKLGTNFLYFLSKSSIFDKFNIILFSLYKVKEEDIKDNLFFLPEDINSISNYLVKIRLKNLKFDEIISLSPIDSMFKEILIKYKIDLIISLNQDKEEKEKVLDLANLYGIDSISLYLLKDGYLIFKNQEFKNIDFGYRFVRLDELLEINSKLLKFLYDYYYNYQTKDQE